MRWFCSFKAYGDLVIACNCLRKVDAKQNGLLAGSHLRPLLDAIEFNGTLRILETGERVPLFFDTKKNGYVSAVRNGFLLRKKIQASVQQRGDLLVFDALGVRQRFLAWPFHAEAVGKVAGNIYLDYARYLGLPEDCCAASRNSRIKRDGKVYIFPDSRIKVKELPDNLVNSIAKENKMCGKKTVLIKVGKPGVLPQFDSLQLQWIDGFDQLIGQVRKADILVSADSLPVHLAEYIGIPVFVFTPIPNDYWMPLSSFKHSCFSGFNSLTRYKEWINLI